MQMKSLIRNRGPCRKATVGYTVISIDFPVSTDLLIISPKNPLVLKEPTISTCLRGENTLLNSNIHKMTDLWEQFTSKLVLIPLKNKHFTANISIFQTFNPFGSFAHLSKPRSPQKKIMSSLYHPGSIHKISLQSVHNIFSNVLTNRQTKASENITFFAKGVIKPQTRMISSNSSILHINYCVNIIYFLNPII